MPQYWKNGDAARRMDAEMGTTINQKIVADKKPYFMKYRYKDVAAEYNAYLKASRFKCAVKFGVTLDDLLKRGATSDDERIFLEYYHKLMPVNDNSCTMNRLCKAVEEEIANIKDSWKSKMATFNYNVYRSDATYEPKDFLAVAKIIDGTINRYNEMLKRKQSQSMGLDELSDSKRDIMLNTKRKCHEICCNEEQLQNIVLDYTYGRGKLYNIAWDIVGDQIVKTLIRRNNGEIRYYSEDETGDIEYKGMRFKECVAVECDEDDSDNE